MQKIHDVLLSEYGAASSIPSAVNRLMTDFAVGFRDGRDINLGVGYVNERTIPHRAVQLACEKVLSHPQKYRAALNYGGAQGSPNLIASLRRFYIENRIGGITEQTLNGRDIVIGANGATSLLESITHVLPTGIVLTADPMYYIYCNDLERKGFKVVTIPEDSEGFDTQRLKSKLAALGDEKAAIRFFYVVTVNNPTCTILSNNRKKELVDIATQLSSEIGRKIPLVFDNAYSDLVHDSTVEPLESALCYDTLGIVYEVGTLSKILAPGLRIGYLIGTKGTFFDSIIQRTSDIGFSAPLINQEIASYLLDHGIEAQIEKVNYGYQQKAKQVKTWMAELLSDNIQEYRGGRAGFYFYLTLANVTTGSDSDFFKFLTRTTGEEEVDGPPDSRHPKVIYIPGEHCVHPNGEMVEIGKRQLRISYGFEELPQIHAALKLMKSAVAYSREKRQAFSSEKLRSGHGNSTGDRRYPMNTQNLPEDTFKALEEKPLLMTGFKPAALIYTYTQPKHVQVIDIKKYELICSDIAKDVVLHLPKINVMFAIKSDTLETVKNAIYIQEDVKKRNLRTARKRNDRPLVLTNEKLQNGLNRNVRFVMRSGHVLTGQLIKYSTFNIVLNIKGALVLVYRHGVLEYSIRPT